MGYYIGITLLTFFAILENSILIDFRLLEGQPALVMVAVIAWSWHADIGEALFWAFVGGIALDLLNPIIPTGTSVIAMVIVIFTVKTVERLFYQVSIFALIAFIAVGTLLHHLILYIIFNVQGIQLPIAEYVQAYSIPTLAFNLLGILPMYWVLRRIQKRLPQRQSAWSVAAR